MFELLLVLTAISIVLALICAFDGGNDVLHPMNFLAPMMFFLYVWMPWKLYAEGHLDGFFDPSQLEYVQFLNLGGVCCLSLGVLAAGFRKYDAGQPVWRVPDPVALRLVIGGCLVGAIGLACWLVTIINVGGFVNAFGKSYSGGWDDSGYIRDANLLLLGGVLLILSGASQLHRPLYITLAAFFAAPWLTQALLTARRGPTFAIVTVVAMGWFLTRGKRPASITVILAGGLVGYLVLFLVTNRSSIHLGSDFDVSTDVTSIVEKSDTGNEFIYGSGTVLASERRDHYFWGKRYLAQVLIRPFPSAIWPTKYEDFGVPELRNNAGTGEGIADALGWEGAVGSAPGIIADTWIEFHWLNLPFLFLLGLAYGWTWRKALSVGGPWNTQFAILSALSIYLIMQTMEAVIFRTVMLSLPCWVVWKWALRAANRFELNDEVPDALAFHPGSADHFLSEDYVS